MSAEFCVRLDSPFPVRALVERTGRLTGLDLQSLALTPDVIRNGVPADLAPEAFLDAGCGPGVEQPGLWLRLAAGDGVADLSWTESDGVWLTVSATWRTEASTLLSAYVSIAAAQLARSAIQDSDALLVREGPVDPDALLTAVRQAAPAALAAGPPGSEPYAATLLRAL